jgi:hypothetical protein
VRLGCSLVVCEVDSGREHLTRIVALVAGSLLTGGGLVLGCMVWVFCFVVFMCLLRMLQAACCWGGVVVCCVC